MKSSIKKLYDTGLFDIYDSADEVLKDCLLFDVYDRRRRDLDRINDDVIQ